MKRWIRKAGLPLIGFLLWGVRAEASSQDIILKTEENKVTVTMGASEENLVSMQLSLEVKVTEGDADTKVSFEFDDGLPGSVRQYRYDRNAGVLTLYVSGSAGQKLSSGEYSLGNVVLKAGEGAASAVVSVKQNSLQFVNDAYDLYQVGEINATPEQKVTDGETHTEVPPDSGGDGSHNGSSGGGGSGGSSGGSDALPPAADAGTGPSPAVRVKPGRGVGIRTEGSYTASADGSEDTSGETKPEETGEGAEEKDDSDTAKRPDGPLSMPEEEADRSSGKSAKLFLLLGLTAALAAAGVVIFLMVQEYDRRRKRARARSRRRPQTKRTGKPSHEKKKRKTDKDRP